MREVTLLRTTGDPRIDALLGGLIGLVELVFPNRIRSYYLFGSYADGSYVATSDIDLCLVPTAPLTAREEAQRERLARSCALLSGKGVDLIAISEEVLLRKGHFRIAAGSRLVYGADLRDRMPPTSFDAYQRRYVQAPWDYITQVLRRDAFRAAGYLAYPLHHPDPAGPFYGYDQARLPHREEPVPNIHALVATACWIATVIIALRTNRTVEAKSASVRLYKDFVNDGWTHWLEALYEHGARRWGYLVPDESAERQELRDLCAPMLAFENHYLRLFRSYLLAQLHLDAASKRLAAQSLSTVIYPDDETLTTLRALSQDADHDVRHAAATALDRVQEVRSRC